MSFSVAQPHCPALRCFIYDKAKIMAIKGLTTSEDGPRMTSAGRNTTAPFSGPVEGKRIPEQPLADAVARRGDPRPGPRHRPGAAPTSSPPPPDSPEGLRVMHRFAF